MHVPCESKVLGLGSDIVDIVRLRKSFERQGQRLLHRLFTSGEQAYCLRYRDAVPHFAGHIAAKEAGVKALGVGFIPGISWLDLEVDHDSFGKPVLLCSSRLLTRFNDPTFLLSVSHSVTYALAVAIWISR